jgi:hypothetical protein
MLPADNLPAPPDLRYRTVLGHRGWEKE